MSSAIARWREKNREKLREYKRSWYAENKEKNREYQRNYYYAHREEICARRRKAKTVTATQKSRQKINSRCKVNKSCRTNQALWWYDVVESEPTFVLISAEKPTRLAVPCCAACKAAIRNEVRTLQFWGGV